MKKMNLPLKHPQEIEVWYVLPAIRKELALALKAQGKSQKDIAQLLGLSEAAVSQYLSKKRAMEISLPEDVRAFIAKKAEKISGPHYAYTIIQVIHAYIKESKTLCQMHQRVEPGLEECTLCYE